MLRMFAMALAAALTAGSVAAAAAPGAKPAPEDGVPWQDEMVLLAPGSDPAARSERLARTIAAAEAGHADAAFLLGALYRSGNAHPSKAVPRDDAKARHWLERCLDNPHCTPVTLYSLAELELTQGNAPRAMQWAQIAAIFDREIAREVETEPRFTGGYLPGLLARAFAALPEAQRSDENVQALVAAMVKERGAALDRMLENEIIGAKRKFDGTYPWPKVPGKSMPWKRRRVPDGELYALYALEIPASGGRPTRVMMIEGLPRPRAARGLEIIASLQEFVPYTPDEGADSGGGWLPITFDPRRYRLKQK